MDGTAKDFWTTNGGCQVAARVTDFFTITPHTPATLDS